MVTYLGSLVQRNAANKQHWCVWGVLTVSGPHCVCPHSWHLCFPSLHCSGSRLLCRASVYKAGPGLPALPRSKTAQVQVLRCSTKAQTQSSLHFVPSQVQAAQVTRCLASTLSPGEAVHLIISLVPATQFPGCEAGVPSQVCHVSPLGS